jgi:hypothetical protein
MKLVWLCANLTKWMAFRPSHATLTLFKWDGYHTHGAQTGEQKCRAEPLPIDLAVYLVGRLLDSEPLEHSRKLFVSDDAPNHLTFYQLRGSLLPSLVRVSLLATLALQFVHRYAAAFRPPPLFRVGILSRQFSVVYDRCHVVVTTRSQKVIFVRTNC